jgi:hypothetical protein
VWARAGSLSGASAAARAVVAGGRSAPRPLFFLLFFFPRAAFMIKTFEQIVQGQAIQLCASFGEGAERHRAIISAAESAKTLVIIEVAGLFETIKVGMESPEQFLDQAIQKAQKDGLIERAVTSGEVQTGKL